MLALDRATGRELWRREVPRRQTGGSRTSTARHRRRRSPTAHSVYAFFQDFGLIAFTTDGKELWQMPLGPFNMFYGFGASPIVVDGTLVLPVDQDTGSYLLGVDAKTGKPRYKIDRPGVISGYSTPTVYRAEGRRQAAPRSRSRSSSRPTPSRTAIGCGGCAASPAR